MPAVRPLIENNVSVSGSEIGNNKKMKCYVGATNKKYFTSIMKSCP